MARQVGEALDPIAFRQGFEKAWAWAASHEWTGVDPYDALSSPLALGAGTPLGRWPAIAFTQVLRRLPFDPRPLLGIRPARNPKAVALLASAAARAGLVDACGALARILLSLRSPGYPALCWGYPFPWRSRAFFLPAWTPTVVVTSFAGEACLDAHAATGSPDFLTAARSACDFVLNLARTTEASGSCLSYSPTDRTAVYNASVLGARLLILAGTRLGEPALVEAARPLVHFVVARQGVDGSWRYGEADFHSWIDSFHTGFVLCALDAYRRATNDPAVEESVRRGAAYYAERLFGPEGEPRFAPDRTYPMDVHSAAQGVLTFLQLRDLSPDFAGRAHRVGAWMIEHLLDRSGAFHYQVRRTHTVRIPYMRWSQAWGIRALAELSRETGS